MFVFLLLVIIYLLFTKYKNNISKGEAGENLIFKELISAEGYKKILKNVYIPYKNKTTEIDIILLHETRFFVIESKNFKGWIFGSLNQKYWTQSFKTGLKTKFYNPILQNNTHINALSQYLNMDKHYFLSTIVFGNHCILKSIPNNSNDYMILYQWQLKSIINHKYKNQPHYILPYTIDKIYEKLLPLAQVSKEYKQKHILDINKNLE